MNAKKWMFVISVALLCIVVWYWQQDSDTKPTVGNASTASVVQPTPIFVGSSASPSPPPLIVQATKRTIAPTVVRRIDEYVDWQRELVAGLIVANDADSIMAAALILHALYVGDTAEQRTIRRLLARAYSLAPGDRTIASVVLRVCRSMSECDAAQYDSAVRTIDARNVLGPLPEALNKIETGTAKQVTEALEILAGLRLNLYNADSVARVASAISRTPTSPRFAPATSDLLRLQSELALSAVQAVEVPSYLAIGPACQTFNWRNTNACKAIVYDLSRSELIELQRLGIEIESARLDNRTKRPAEIEDAEIYLNWVGSMKANTLPPADQWIGLLAQHRTELAASRAWLERNGVTQRRVPRWFERLR